MRAALALAAFAVLAIACRAEVTVSFAHVGASAAREVLRQHLPEVTATPDASDTQLTLSGPAAALDEARQVLAMLDVPVPNRFVKIAIRDTKRRHEDALWESSVIATPGTTATFQDDRIATAPKSPIPLVRVKGSLLLKHLDPEQVQVDLKMALQTADGTMRMGTLVTCRTDRRTDAFRMRFPNERNVAVEVMVTPAP